MKFSIEKKKIFAIVFGLTLIVFTSKAVAQGDTWELKASMPTAQGAQATGVIDGKLYVWGVDPSASFASVLSIYHPAIDTWFGGTASPTRRAGNAYAVIDGKLYVAGGCRAFGSAGPDCRIGVTNLLEVYDPVTDSWTTLASMPTARGFLAGTAVDGKFHVVGGNVTCGACIPLATHEVYDPVTNTWQAKASMPVAVNSPEAVAIDGKLFVVGGQDSFFTYTGILQVYDPATGNWDISRAPMPTGRFEFAAGVIDGRLYAVGGNAAGLILDTLEEYDPAADTWVTRAPMPTARWSLGAGVIDEKLYAVGGSDNISFDTVEVYTPPIVTPAQAVENLIDDIVDLGLPKNVANSLLAPLNNATAILEDGNPNNDVAACGKLNAFINNVNAKENSGKLTATEADGLRQAAEAIETKLGCP